MAVADESWQTMRSTVKERIAFLFHKEILSDVKFVVPLSTGKSETGESKKVIPAHKFVLAISSPVFFAMFYGQLAETTDSIELPDCDYESLLEMLRFFYSDEVNLSGSNAMQVSYLAKKYMVPSLAEKCTEYLRENLDASNVFCILPHVQKFEDKDLEDRCWEVVEKQTDEALKSDEFVTVERSLVESVVKREVTEIELFKAVDRWATKESERQGRTSGEVKREILGEEIVKAIRFPLMSQKEFISAVPDCNILTTKEIVDMMKYFNDVLMIPLQFSAARRVKADMTIHQCRRFKEWSPSRSLPPVCRVSDILNPPFKSYNGNCDRIRFTVSKAIQLLGVQHFGSANGTYNVTCVVKDTTDGSVIVRKSQSYLSEKHVAPDQSYSDFYAFDVMFDDPVYVEQNKLYKIESLISGPFSWFGEKGKASVECCGVVFSFRDSNVGPSNRTAVPCGQFPALLFCPA